MREAKPAFALLAHVSLKPLGVTSILSTCCLFTPLSFPVKGMSSSQASRFIIKASTDNSPNDLDMDRELVLEGDVLAYREHNGQPWSIGAVVEIPDSERYNVRSLCSRRPEEDGSVECFVNWEGDSGELSIQSETYEIAIVDADYEERVVQDRLANPHGEVSEDCWRISMQVLDSFNVRIPRI